MLLLNPSAGAHSSVHLAIIPDVDILDLVAVKNRSGVYQWFTKQEADKHICCGKGTVILQPTLYGSRKR